jgi:hypothetical protein
VCGLGFTAVLAVRAPLTGETRPRAAHGHAPRPATLESGAMPRLLDFTPTYAEHVKPILEAN